LFSGELSELSFRVKPGFKAIEKKKGANRHECKKKVMIRGQATVLLPFPTKYNNNFVCVLSRGDRAGDSYLKIIYLSKFHVMIKQTKF
jgi:hypothetical protein